MPFSPRSFKKFQRNSSLLIASALCRRTLPCSRHIALLFAIPFSALVFILLLSLRDFSARHANSTGVRNLTFRQSQSLKVDPRSLCAAYYQVDELVDAHSLQFSTRPHPIARDSTHDSVRDFTHPSSRGSTRLPARTAPLGPSSGRCPPAPALCGLRDLFDEVVVIVLPRLERRFVRITAQLAALNVPFTSVQGRDARAGGMAAVAEAFMAERKEASAGVLALALTHLAVLDYFARAPPNIQRVLLLEDDAILHADFPRALDERARRLPAAASADWRLLLLGATLFPSDADLARFDEQGVVAAGPNVEIYSSFAVGIHREAAALIARTMVQNRTPIDAAPYRAVQTAWPRQVAALWPPVALAPPFAESALGHAQDLDAADWARRSGFEAHMFDLERGYYVGGEAGNAPQCDVVKKESGEEGEGMAGEKGEAWVDEPFMRVAAESADACCAQCLRLWPRCRAWAWAEAPGWLRRKEPARRNLCQLGVLSFPTKSVFNGAVVQLNGEMA